MNVGFDLDKIFINFPPFVPTKIIDWLYKGKPNGTLKYRMPSRVEQIIRILSHYPLFRPPMIKNMNYVKNISKKNAHNYFLISGRFSFLKNRTDELIKKYGLDKVFKKIFINLRDEQPHIFKSNLMKRLQIDKYVDDDLFLLKYAAKQNPKTNFFWLNKKISKKLENNLLAIKNLSEMF